MNEDKIVKRKVIERVRRISILRHLHIISFEQVVFCKQKGLNLEP